MTKPSSQEQIELDRFARKHERHLKFLRETPRDERNIPISEELVFQRASIGEVAIWIFIWGCIAVFLLYMLSQGEIDVAKDRTTASQASQNGLYAPVQGTPPAVPQAQR